MNTFIGAFLLDVVVAGRELLYASSTSLSPLPGICVLFWVTHSMEHIGTVLKSLMLLREKKKSKKRAPTDEN